MTPSSLLCATASFSLVAGALALLSRGHLAARGRRRVAASLWALTGVYTVIVVIAGGAQLMAWIHDGTLARMGLTEGLITLLMWVMLLIGIDLPLIEIATHLRHGGLPRGR